MSTLATIRPAGADAALGKTTFVTQLGIDGAKQPTALGGAYRRISDAPLWALWAASLPAAVGFAIHVPHYLAASEYAEGALAALNARAVAELEGRITALLQDVKSLDHDRALRRLAALIGAIKRTNFYQTDADGAPKPHISIKIASRELDDLPLPKPYREIFVWAPHVEGVHLRFGPVARGGLRWSDRRDDFRTEVLDSLARQSVLPTRVLVVGDARSNGFDPQVDLFAELARRVHRVAWLTPEPRRYWTQTGCALDEYSLHCSGAVSARDGTELIEKVDELGSALA